MGVISYSLKVLSVPKTFPKAATLKLHMIEEGGATGLNNL